MNVHVNFLHDDERRYQGLVGRKFIVIAASSAVVGLLAIVGTLLGYNLISAQQELQMLRASWRQTEQQYKSFLAQQKVRDLAAGVLGELRGATHGRLPMHDFLLEVQRIVAPFPVQLDHITITSEASLVQPPPPKVAVSAPAGTAGILAGAWDSVDMVFLGSQDASVGRNNNKESTKRRFMQLGG